MPVIAKNLISFVFVFLLYLVQHKQRVRDVSWPSSSGGNYVFPDPKFTLQCSSPPFQAPPPTQKKNSSSPKSFSVAVIINRWVHVMASFSFGKKDITVFRVSLLGYCALIL